MVIARHHEHPIVLSTADDVCAEGIAHRKACGRTTIPTHDDRIVRFGLNVVDRTAKNRFTEFGV